MDELRIANYRAALLLARTALKFYGDQVYSHTMGLTPDVQFVAEQAIDDMDNLLAFDTFYRNAVKESHGRKEKTR